MKRVFADSSYFIAVLSRTDAHHQRAGQLAINLRDRLVTTHWVIAEVLGYLSSPAIRRSSSAFMRRLLEDPATHVVPPDQSLFNEGFALFQQHHDKAWSLVDCISFVVMRRRRIREALTADHHFAQAGFVPLLAQ
ncbi:MAG: PIN domain-containing protein [Phycisphaerae bacterium]|nr:PIN domain-containing protein [Phycisphaerae bacterium]